MKDVLLLDSSGGLTEEGERMREKWLLWWRLEIEQKRSQNLRWAVIVGLILFLLTFIGLFVPIGSSLSLRWHNDWPLMLGLPAIFTGVLVVSACFPTILEEERRQFQASFQGQGEDFLAALKQRNDPALRTAKKIFRKMCI